MEKPTLVVAKIELRFDTSGGLKDCIPPAHEYMRGLGFAQGAYELVGYDIDKTDQQARVITFLIGLTLCGN